MAQVTSNKTVLALLAHNGEKFISDTIRSILTQTHSEFKLLIVDDGSTDATPSIVQSLQKTDSRIFCYRNETRLGLVGNSNLALSLAGSDCDYFAWVSDHDLYHPLWLEKLVALLETNPKASIAYPITSRIDEVCNPLGAPRYVCSCPASDRRQRLTELRNLKGFGDIIYGLFRAEKLRKVGGYPAQLFPDTLLISELCLEGPLLQLAEPLWFRRFYVPRTGPDVVEHQLNTLFVNPPMYALSTPWPVSHYTKLFNKLVLDQSSSSADRRALGLEFCQTYREVFFRKIKWCYPALEGLTEPLAASYRRLEDATAQSLKLQTIALHRLKPAKIKDDNNREQASTPAKGFSKAAEITLSIIICTYNRAQFLEECLDSIVRQTTAPGDFEVVVVDNNCTDNTAEIVSRYQQKIPKLTRVIEDKQGLSNSRNRGYFASKGEYLFFLDDDARLPENYLDSLYAALDEHQPDLLGGPVYPYYKGEKPAWFPDEIETRKYAKISGFSRKASVSGGNFIIRREELNKLGLFDANLGMRGGNLGMLEERKMLETYRLTTPLPEQRVYYSLDCFIEHFVDPSKMHLSYIFERAYVTGQAAFDMYRELHGSPDYLRAPHRLLMAKVQGDYIIDQFETPDGMAHQDDLLRLLATQLRSVGWAVGYAAKMLEDWRWSIDSSPAKEVYGYLCGILQQLLRLEKIATPLQRSYADQVYRYLEKATPLVGSLVANQPAGPACADLDYRQLFPDFDSEVYLANHDEASNAVAAGQISSAWEHFKCYGITGSHDPRYSRRLRRLVIENGASEHVDVLWLAERRQVELPVATCVKEMIESRNSLKVEIRSFYAHVSETLERIIPRVVVLPFFTESSEAVLREYVERWPDATFVCCGIDRGVYEGNKFYRLPKDAKARTQVLHYTWGRESREILEAFGVAPGNILTGGDLALQLYAAPYHKVAKSRDELAELHNLDAKKRWVFVAENHPLALISDDAFASLCTNDRERESLEKLREHAQVSLAYLLKWSASAALNGDIELIFRPHPRTFASELQAFNCYVAGNKPVPGLHITKVQTPYDWVSASDVVIASQSTILLEAAVAGKPTYLAEPVETPVSCRASWYPLVSRINKLQQFRSICATPNLGNANQLAKWAFANRLESGDPITGFADKLVSIVAQHQATFPKEAIRLGTRPLLRLPIKVRNTNTHEGAGFYMTDVTDYVDKWRTILPTSAVLGKEVTKQSVTINRSIEKLVFEIDSTPQSDDVMPLLVAQNKHAKLKPIKLR